MKLNDFVFVTCLTPKASLTPLRTDLFELYKSSLLAQESSNWSAILMGEEDKTEGNFIFIKAKTVTKEEKLLELFELLKDLPVKPKFLIRLDDDDIFSPTIIKKIEKRNLDFDVYVDKFQSMFNVSDLRSLSKEYSWFPSTIIMKFEDAMKRVSFFNDLPLFVCDHDLVFHKYFQNRRIFFSPKDEPIYLRVFSPTSLSFNDSNRAFEEYCKRFGVWKYFSFNEYQIPLKQLELIHNKYFKPVTVNRSVSNIASNFKIFIQNIKSALSGLR